MCLFTSDTEETTTATLPTIKATIPENLCFSPTFYKTVTFSNSENKMSTKPRVTTRPVVICGPSGCGKSTVIHALINKYPQAFYYCVSHTTRPRRPDEVDGKDYHFVSPEEFNEAVKSDHFIEYSIFSGYYYGTKKTELETAVKRNRICLMDLDIQGVEEIQKTPYNPICIFIRPRNFATLEKRLRSRSTETEDRILQRLAVAHQEMQYGISDGKFDAILVNDDLNKTVLDVMKVVQEATKE
ncbi:Guanylate kinase [Fasciola hepatica]|uniref:guanylate kinase n=1 Tax=Fasciola hepatica TaxID=6192 RepID=A0A4E0R4M8_FASHE|nr:Guanylate kinase [Fasciola hepatica]